MTGGHAAPERDLALLPKAHLHVHLEAAIRPATVTELARQHRLTVAPTPAGADFAAFAGAFLGLIAILALPGVLRRVVHEAAVDAEADGAVYLELGVSPQFYAAQYGSADAALAELCDAAADAGSSTGVQVGLMVTVDRTAPVAEGMALARLAAGYAGRGVVSLGLANSEVGHPGAPFAEAFALARSAGLRSTPHAGELLGAASVAEAVDVLGAQRVQHGIRVLEDPALTARLAARGVVLDVCPTSNTFLGLVPDVSRHPLPRLLDAGVACSINADDPTIFGVGVLDEYRTCRSALGLTDEQLASCARTSIQASPVGDTLKARALAGIDTWLAAPPTSSRGSR
ncbi:MULTISPECIES: adenosine deaminase [unclassified Modestobacter]